MKKCRSLHQSGIIGSNSEIEAYCLVSLYLHENYPAADNTIGMPPFSPQADLVALSFSPRSASLTAEDQPVTRGSYIPGKNGPCSRPWA